VLRGEPPNPILSALAPPVKSGGQGVVRRGAPPSSAVDLESRLPSLP
jgi:hypothetical protein